MGSAMMFSSERGSISHFLQSEMPWPVANSENYPQAASTVSVWMMIGLQGLRALDAGASSSLEIWGRLEPTTTVPAPAVWIGKKITLRQPTETRRNAAYGCLPLTDTLLPLMWLWQLAATLSTTVFAGGPFIWWLITPPQAVILGPQPSWNTHHDRADATELSFRAWSDKNRYLGKSQHRTTDYPLDAQLQRKRLKSSLAAQLMILSKKANSAQHKKFGQKFQVFRNQVSKWYDQ
jgi:hypothetical protein